MSSFFFSLHLNLLCITAFVCLFFGLLYARSFNFIRLYNIIKLTALFGVCCSGLLCFYFIFYFPQFNLTLFNNLLRVNYFTLITQFVIISSLILIFAVSFFYETKIIVLKFENIGLMLFSGIGSCILVQSSDLVIFYLGLELQTLPVYFLISSSNFSKKSIEAGIKYFILSLISSSFLLFGLALIYYVTGLTNFSDLKVFCTLASEQVLLSGSYSYNFFIVLLVVGIIFLSFGVFFKLAVAPFHFWTPDIYDGASGSIILLLTTIPKYSVSIIFVYMFFIIFEPVSQFLNLFFLIIGCLSIFVGVLGATFYTKISKIIAFGSTAHFGFILLAFGCLNNIVTNDELVFYILFYLVFYLFSTFLFFTLWLNTTINDKVIQYVSDFNGLAKKSKFCSLLFAISFFSYAGLPPLIGFTAKIFILKAVLTNFFVIFASFIFFLSVISAVYYLRIIQSIFFTAEVDSIKVFKFPKVGYLIVSVLFCIALLILTVFFMA